jgi:hypothetical protein
MYASQDFPRLGSLSMPLQNSNYKNDLIELLYVIHALIAMGAYKAKALVFTSPVYTERSNNNFLLMPGDFFADPETMMKNPIADTARGRRCIRSMLQFPLDYSTQSITTRYMMFVDALPNFVTDHVHEKLAAALSDEDYSRFMARTPLASFVQCQICSSAATFTCSSCYHGTSFLCSDACANDHVCK